MKEELIIKRIADDIVKVRDIINSSNEILENIVFEKYASGASIEANRSGLLELAHQIILLAAASGPGKSIDIDTASFASASDGILTISLNEDL